MRPRSALAAAVLFVASAELARADDSLDRVRVTLAKGHGRRVVGRLVEATGETLTVQPAAGPPITVDRATVTRLERSAGLHSRGQGSLRGMGIGAAVGVWMGAMVGAAVTPWSTQCASGSSGGGLAPIPSFCGSDFGPREQLIVTGALLYGAGGAALGGVTGALVRRERWVDASEVGVGWFLLPERGGARAGLRVRF